MKRITLFLLAGFVWSLGAAFSRPMPETERDARFGSSAGNQNAPQNLTVPPMAFDQHSIALTWEKPPNYYEKQRGNQQKRIADYEIWQNGARLKARSSANFSSHYEYLDIWNKAFYAGTADYKHYQLTYLSYIAAGLAPDTQYTFKVRACYADGGYSDFSKEITVSTAKEYTQVIEITPASPQILAVEDKKANQNRYVTKDAGGDPETKTRISASTAALQAAIDAVPPGGKLALKGTGDNRTPRYYISGAIFLHSNMTFEIEKGAVLLGSPVFDDYQRNLLVYPYSADIRSQGLINAVTWDYGTLENIRLCGEGIVDGNGWQSAGDGIQEAADLDPARAGTESIDPTNGAGAGQWVLPNFFAGNARNVSLNGILAGDAMDKANADECPNQGGENSSPHYSTRPQLTVFRGVKGLCLEGLTFTNPAHHGIVNYQCEGVTSIGVKVMTFNCNNGDGIEFGDCRDLYILNNFYDTGDDAINFAAGQGASVRNTSGKAASGGGKAVNNYVRNGHGGLIAAGSHTAGWIGDLLVEDNIFKGSETGGAGVIRLKSGGTTGGGVRNITFRDSAIHHQRSSAPVVQIDRNYSDSNASTAYAPESEVPVVYEDIFMRNITISGVSTKELVGCTNPVWAKQGYKMVARKFHVEDIAILSTGDGGNKIRVQDVSDSSFKNIRYAGNVDGYVSLTDCRNITVQNITGTSGVQPDIIPASLDWRSDDSLAVSVEGNKVTLRWNPIPGADGGYKILAKEDSPLSRYFTERASVDPGVTAWTGYFSPNTRYALGVLAQSAEANGNTAISGTALTASVATGANTAPPGVPIPPQTLTIGNAAHSGVSWMNLSWTNAAPGDNGIQYYKIRAAETATGRETEYRCYYPAYWSFDAPLGHPNRSGYGLADLKDGTEYTATVSAVDWAGGESTAYQPLTFTTVPGTLMEIPRWKSSSVLAGELSQDGGTLRLSWNAVDVTDRAGGDGVSRFAGYRITVNGVPVPAVSPTGEVLNQVNAVSNTQDTVFDLDVRAYKPGTYTVSVEAGDEILKIASGTGGLAGAASFLGTKNTEKLRNTITFGKWTGHGPKITVTLKD